MTKKKICFVTAVPGTAQSFLKDHIKALSKHCDVYLACNTTQDKVEMDGLQGVFHFPIERNISIGKDLRAVKELTKYFKRQKFDIVHSVTPKAGLVTALAGRLARIPHRIHIFTGQVWATRTGAMRLMLKYFDKLIVLLNNHLLVDGRSQRQFLIDQHVLTQRNSQVLGAGSICGANTDRFTPTPEVRKRQRTDLGLKDSQIVFAFMGRLNADKGIYELLQAFNIIATTHPEAHLLIYGNDEEGCLTHLPEYPNIKQSENFTYGGVTHSPHLSLQAADVFCLPSYREGFGMSVVEAQSLELPAICSDAYGLADTIKEGETGLRCRVRDAYSLADAMRWMIEHPDQRKRMGEEGRKRVLYNFATSLITTEWIRFYRQILKS